MITAVLFDLFETLITETGTRPTRASSLGVVLGFDDRAYRREWKARRPRVVQGSMDRVGGRDMTAGKRRGAETARAQVRAYLAALPPDVRRAVKTLLATVRAAAPGAVPSFSYGIPGFRLDDRPLVWCAGWQQHTSLYPITARIRRGHAAAIAGFDTSTGTVRFPLDKPIPVSLVKRLKSRIVELRSKRPRRWRTHAGLAAGQWCRVLVTPPSRRSAAKVSRPAIR